MTRGHNMGKLPELVWLTRELELADSIELHGPTAVCALRGRYSVLAAAFREVLSLIPESREDLNPIAVSLLRERLLRLECACVESCCDGGVSGSGQQ